MRLLVVAGFLGSGKTTLVLSLATAAVRATLRVAVVVNEVGEVGIDGSVFRLGDLQVKEITAGCICCQIGVDLVRTLVELDQTFAPDLVIVEASGIAAPAGVLDALRYYPADKIAGISTVTLVDPLRFEALYEVVTPLIEAQITGADVLVVTKKDQATATELEYAVRMVGNAAPGVPLYVVDATSEENVDGIVAVLLANEQAG